MVKAKKQPNQKSAAQEQSNPTRTRELPPLWLLALRLAVTAGVPREKMAKAKYENDLIELAKEYRNRAKKEEELQRDTIWRLTKD